MTNENFIQLCKEDGEVDSLLKYVEKRTIEECAKIAEPKGPRPCDCERCHCGNYGDAEAVAGWDSDMATAKQIRALAEKIKS
jgi:hypothetical protein